MNHKFAVLSQTSSPKRPRKPNRRLNSHDASTHQCSRTLRDHYRVDVVNPGLAALGFSQGSIKNSAGCKESSSKRAFCPPIAAEGEASTQNRCVPFSRECNSQRGTRPMRRGWRDTFRIQNQFPQRGGGFKGKRTKNCRFFVFGEDS